MAVTLTINGQLYHGEFIVTPYDSICFNAFIITSKTSHPGHHPDRHHTELIYSKPCPPDRNQVYVFRRELRCLHGECGRSPSRLAGVNVFCCEFFYSCRGMDITTIEGIGSKAEGYHPIQQRLARFNGTQCGVCSPGMVMNMYGLMESSKGSLTMEEIEKSFAGNVCRCTGYRPIMDAMKSFATDASSALVEKCRDIEDLGESCSRGRKCLVKCAGSVEKKAVHLYFDNEKEWHKVYSVVDVFEILRGIGCRPYSLVAGCTGQGVYRDSEDVKVIIDINSIEELHSHWIV